MSAIYIENRLVHYEVFGRGQPIIFLHSWLGSWRYWVPTMDTVSERYRAYALDFWGFGESDRQDSRFTVAEYAEMIIAFMNELGLAQANLVGHGLGGMVAVRVARDYPERFLRLMTVATPFQGQVIREISRPGTFSRLLGRGKATNIWSKLVRQFPIDDTEMQQELYEDTDGLSETLVERVQQSILNTDLQPTLAKLDSVPLLAVYGEKDTIVTSEHASFLSTENGRPHQLLVLPGVSHFPFLEQTATFNRLLLDFLVSEGSPVEIKEQWRRRVSQREYL